MCLCAAPPDLMEKDSEGREEEPSAPGLKVTDCFPSETFETLSFLSRPSDGGGRGETNAIWKIRKWEIFIFGTHHLQSVRGESSAVDVGFT